MEKCGNNKSSNHADSAMSFWKKNSKTVPGRPSPSKESLSWGKPKSSGGTSSFQDFQDSVRDAWDIEDDEFSVISAADVKISKKVAQSTALSVINSHRSGSISSPTKLSSVQPQPDVQHTNPVKSAPSSTKPSGTSNSGPNPIVNANIESVYKPEPASVYSNLPNGNSEIPIVPGALRNNLAAKPRVINRLETESEKVKADKIRSLLQGTGSTDLKELQSLSYSGLPVSVRGTTWKLLAGYLPANIERREQVLQRKREEYWKCVQQYYDSRKEESHQDTFRQIHIDIPRMCPLIALFQQRVVQEMFERILFIWAIRHPASGYVQGMNDLVTPFFVVFLEEVLPPDLEVETFDVSRLKDEIRNNIEADSYWCMSKFLDSIQVNYIFAQTGIQEKVKKLKELIERIDAPLHHHLQRHEIDYLQFSFRWMNNLLMRELPLRCTIRLWDTYLSEPDGCGSVLLYVCAAFLRHWREQLTRQNDFQGLMLLLQNLPTQNWESSEISLIVAEAYRLKYTYDNTHWH
ncbi:TBC1 domain family member 22B [Orchesella cincta]|uniref:TBC1 domain family member 22B n=1 Tax=Orchesella cincta TaxID=48709 RepID=A0A1D2NK40_ORCCI|nr:TBC1 domain family member 22B [Orchesella cincta]